MTAGMCGDAASCVGKPPMPAGVTMPTGGTTAAPCPNAIDKQDKTTRNVLGCTDKLNTSFVRKAKLNLA